MLHNLKRCSLLALAIACLISLDITAAEEEKPRLLSLSEGNIELTAPKDWVKEEPRTRIVDFEFSVPKVEGDPDDGRLTVMGAGGSVEQNIDRWIGQFSQPDGGSTRDRAKIEKKSINKQEVHLVDIAGTFKDQLGPFAPAEMREDYRMLSAIIRTEKRGQYFIKLTGPKKTVEANAEAFANFVESLKVK